MEMDLKPAVAPGHSTTGLVNARVVLPSSLAPVPQQALQATATHRGSLGTALRNIESGEGRGKAPAGHSLALQSARYGQWGLISQAQSRIANLQAAEQALVSAYRQLLQVSRQLEQFSRSSHPEQTAVLASRIDQLSSEVRSAPALLDQNLKPRVLQPASDRARYVLSRIDLLTPRSQPERLQLMFSGMRQAVELELPSNADSDQALAVIRGALQPLQVDADLNPRGQLEFSVPASEQSRLNAPLLVTGQGIRVPAGNPVPIPLDVAPSPLEELAAGLRSGDLAPQRQRIDGMLASLQDSQRQLQRQTQQIMARLDQARGAVATAGDAMEVSEELVQVLRRASFDQHVSVLLAQANISRHTAVALMVR